MDTKDRNMLALNLISLQHYFGYATQRAQNIYDKIAEQGLLSGDLTVAIEKIDIGDSLKQKIRDFSYDFADKVMSQVRSHGIKLLLITDSAYPNRLKNIPQPPLVIYYKGTFPLLDEIPAITVVGPRKSSDFGCKAAFSLSYRLAKAGFTIISGAAVGCDTCAHKGALKANGKTIGVLGCGLESDYLSENRELRSKIAETSCLISEYPPFAAASRFSFPVRNRLMAGLGLGTVVIEAGEKSGALITAGHALEQGKDVFVIPGNPTLSQYKGSNALLRDGAIPLIDASDIFNTYLLRFPEKIDIKKAFEKDGKPEAVKKNDAPIKKSDETLSKDAKMVYNYLDKQKFTADDLIGCGLSADEILSALTELEIEKFIKALPGGSYSKI